MKSAPGRWKATALVLVLILGVGVGEGTTARADLVVPNQFGSIPGPATQFGILGDGVNAQATFQVGYAASQLTGLSVGSEISSLGIRLPPGAATVQTDLVYSSYTIEIGQAANPIGSLSATFAANMGADTIVARSGGLTIAAGTLVGGPGLNPFYQIGLTNPYVYQGGDLLITFRYTATTIRRTDLDAVGLSSANLVDTVGTFGSSTATTGDFVHFLNAPILNLGTFRVVPEPSSIVLVGLGLAGLVGRSLLISRRRRSC